MVCLTPPPVGLPTKGSEGGFLQHTRRKVTQDESPRLLSFCRCRRIFGVVIFGEWLQLKRRVQVAFLPTLVSLIYNTYTYMVKEVIAHKNRFVVRKKWGWRFLEKYFSDVTLAIGNT